MFDLPTMTAGLFVGVMVGLTGIGGGALMTPILVLLLGTVPKTAVGTDLFFAAITKMSVCMADEELLTGRSAEGWQQEVSRLPC